MRQEMFQKGKAVNKTVSLQEFNEMIQLNDGIQTTYPIYKTIINAMEHKYSWLGKQVAEELLDSIASSVIDRCYGMPFRSNQHVLLIWETGWFKSSILGDFISMMPNFYFGNIGSITDAALHGTVETNAKPGRQFVPPTVLYHDFLLIREFGKNLTEEAKLKEDLLMVLEDQTITVSRSKFACLDEQEKRGSEVMYAQDNMTWENDTTFRFKTKCTVWAANYNPIEDRAMLERFNIVVPQKKLDSNLRDYVMTHPTMDIKPEAGVCPPYKDINEAVDSVMHSHRPPLPVSISLKKEFEGIRGITPRTHSNILKKLKAAAWWGFWYDSDDVHGMALSSVSAKSESQRDVESTIIEKLLGDWYTVQGLAGELGVSTKKVVEVLKGLRDQPFAVVRKKDSKGKYLVRVYESGKNAVAEKPVVAEVK